MKLLKAIEDYVALKRSLGAVYATEAKRFRSFGRVMGDVPLEEITSKQCQSFCYGPGPATSSELNKHRMLKKFFSHAVGRGHLTRSPADWPTRRYVSTFQPYIYSRAEVGRLLDCAMRISGEFHFDGYTLRTLLLLLYATGLRAGEALVLRHCDVDLSRRILAIWNAKFSKSRLVPFSSDLAQSLNDYLVYRNALPCLPGCCLTLFSARTGSRIHLNSLENAFRRLRAQAEIQRSGGDNCRPPRIHDLRATFAVHRLVTWYQEGADVQQRLPLLATYLGHTSISGTQVYLRMTPELLGEASRRFETYAAVEKEERR